MSPWRWWALTPPFHPCHAGLLREPRSAVCFLCHFPSAFAAWDLPQRPALRCPDFPRAALATRGHPACSGSVLGSVGSATRGGSGGLAARQLTSRSRRRREHRVALDANKRSVVGTFDNVARADEAPDTRAFHQGKNRFVQRLARATLTRVPSRRCGCPRRRTAGEMALQATRASRPRLRSLLRKQGHRKLAATAHALCGSSSHSLRNTPVTLPRTET